MEFLENILVFSLKQDLVYSHESLAEEWLFFCFLNKKRKVFVADDNSGLHKRELLKYHENFPIVNFEEVLSIEILVLLGIFISV